MIDSVKCLGFNELLKQAKTFRELNEKCIQVEGQGYETSREWEQAVTKYLEQEWVSVDALKEFSLVKEHSLRNLLNKALDELAVFVPSTEKIEVYDKETNESWIVTTAKPEQWSMFLDCLDSWIMKMHHVFDETFAEKKGSLQEKKESVSK